MFSSEFCEIFKNAYLQNTSGRPLLNNVYTCQKTESDKNLFCYYQKASLVFSNREFPDPL